MRVQRCLRQVASNTFDGVLFQMARKPALANKIVVDVAPPTPQAVEKSAVAISPAELELRVSETIHELLETQNVWKGEARKEKEDENLTPAQRFYLENKELLVKRATEYSVSRAESDFEKATKEIEDEWAFYRDPVLRPPRAHLWPISEVDERSSSSESHDAFDSSPNEFPKVEEFVEFLSNQKVDDIVSVDLGLCGRRDIGEWAIIGTVKSSVQAERVANLLRRSVNKLELENIKIFINAAAHDQEWIVVRVGSVVIHLMTREDRSKYALEDLYVIIPTGEAVSCSEHLFIAAEEVE